MYYVPSFFETFVILVLALGALSWVGQRAPAARRVMPVLVLGVVLPTAWGGALVWTEQLEAVDTPRYVALAVAFLGLVFAIVWGMAVRDRPVVDE